MDKIQGKIKFIAPSLQDEHYSTAYILGNITWLMMHSKQHETMPLHMMASQIFPAIANKQYVLGMSEKGSPLFYMAWANFDDAAEAEYLTNYNLALTPHNWNGGDRPWILFFAAPFGGAYEGERWIKENLFKDSPEVRFLYHEGKKRGKRILCKRGKNVSAMASLKWHNENMPLVAAPMQLEKDVASLLCQSKIKILNQLWLRIFCF